MIREALIKLLGGTMVTKNIVAPEKPSQSRQRVKPAMLELGTGQAHVSYERADCPSDVAYVTLKQD